MRIAFASDHAGLELRRHVAGLAASLGHEVVDLGAHDATSTDYPDFARMVATRVQAGEVERGVLVCGSGIGMSMAANRFRGVRAVVAMVEHQARLARRHNDANVLCLGQRLVGVELAAEILRVFLAEPFEGGRHARRVEKIEPPSS